MGLFGNWRLVLQAAERAQQQDSQALFSGTTNPTPVDDAIRDAARALSQLGPIPTREMCLQVPGILRGRNLICSIGTWPLVMLDSANNRVDSPFFNQIDPDVPNAVTLSMTIEDLICDSVAWWRVTKRGWDNYPFYARRLDPDLVSLDPPANSMYKLPSNIDPESVIWVDGKPVDGRDMIRFDSPNPGIRYAARRAIRRAAKLELAAELYADNPRAMEYFTPTDGVDPVGEDGKTDNEFIREWLDKWEQARRSRTTAYVPSVLEHNEINWLSPADLQLAELQKRAALDMANILGLDPEDLGISTTSRTYQNATDRRRDRVNEVYRTYMVAITGRLNMGDVTKRGFTTMFDQTEYFRTDPMTMANVHEKRLKTGTMAPSEARTEWGAPPLTAAQKREISDAQKASAPAPAAKSEDGTAEQDTTQENSVKNVTPLRRAQFGAGENIIRLAFASSETDVQRFAVDSEQRTIRGLAVPYNVTATNGWASWRFLPGSLRWSSPNRVKFLLEHNPKDTLGIATELTDTADGLAAAFRVGKGPARDNALDDASDGILDGLSIGVTIDEDGFTYDKKEGAYVVKAASLREISLVSIPAFDDARLTSVAASWNGGTQMHCPLCGGEHAAGAPCNSQLNTQVNTQPPAAPAQAPVAGFDMNAFAAALAPMVQQSAANAAQAAVAAAMAARPSEPEGPAVVNPRQGARTAQLAVREQPMYRFDGYMGQHDFSTDLFAWAKSKGNMPEAQERLERFAESTFGRPGGARGVGFADVSTDDVNELNPTINRPDLYVDQLEYTYPIWSAISKGAVLDATPFTIPKFSSASGLVADHTEGTEPESGTFVTTGQTIQPLAVSGKVEVTRETIDQGGNPQTSTLIWRQIVRAYFESLEARAVAMLEALTPTAIAITAGAVDVDLADEVVSNLSGLQFIRGGFRMRDLFLNQALFTGLANARDTTGRPLFPLVLPQNADGSTADDFAYMMIGMLRARPAWALATSASAEESSYLFSREDVHGWASTPRRLNFEYRIKSVEIGVWGYAVAANTRLDGVREITYDPTM